MKKLVTATTLTAGIGTALVGQAHHADAAENYTNYNNYNYNTTTSISHSGNLYTAGQCTWYVYDKVGGEIGSTWGNANNWAAAAQGAGFTVNHTPSKGAILQSSEGPFGHVAYVESVNSDGSVTISEMNYSGGPFSVSSRTISASEAGNYNYIHI
ncbi:TPA: CHAP domain-containing protein [Staphylococcus aureus]|nr:CHAP domain-containing protein [Staphylococcus aureus]HCY6216488.1 CHAP domain-containing protein [Staphylococcus aureus]